MARIGKNWELLGHVGVDSGQLMVCDPCYIDGTWERDAPPPPHRKLVLTTAGKERFPGMEFAFAWPFPWGHYGDPCALLGGLSINEATDLLLVEEEPRKIQEEWPFNYTGACEATSSPDGGGQLSSRSAEVGVAFSSGYGDGLYPVYGRKNKEGRIVEVRIVME